MASISDKAKEEIIKHYLNLDKVPELLGMGMHASAFLHNGKVYKLTDDLADYITARKLYKKGRRRTKHFATVYKAAILQVNYKGFQNPVELYLIVTEYVKPFASENNYSTPQYEVWNQIVEDNSDRDILAGRCEPYLDVEYFSKFDSSMVNLLFNQYSSAIKELKRLKYRIWDNHTYNFGMKKGTLKIFDFGCDGNGNFKDRKYSKKRQVTLHLNEKY